MALISAVCAARTSALCCDRSALSRRSTIWSNRSGYIRTSWPGALGRWNAHALRYLAWPRRHELNEAEAALHAVGLGHKLRAPTRALSGGEQQRVAIARAVVQGRVCCWQTNIADHVESNVSIVLWLNEAVKGPITANGKEFEESKVYQQHRAKVGGIVRVPHHSAETFGADMEQLLKGRMTFEEGIAVQISGR
jgi:ABC-type transport system involved in cytochrome c biogenesis ATPase subunit